MPRILGMVAALSCHCVWTAASALAANDSRGRPQAFQSPAQAPQLPCGTQPTSSGVRKLSSRAYWFIHKRLLGPIGDIPPAEYEELHYQVGELRPRWPDSNEMVSGKLGAVQEVRKCESELEL